MQRRVRRLMNHWVTEVLVAFLIVVSVGLVIVEAALPTGSPWYETVRFTNYVITVVFVVELSLRFYGEKRKKNFFWRYWYDIIAILPIFRVARFLRIFRLLRVFRFGMIAARRLSRVSRMFRYVRVEYVIITFIALTAVLIGGLSMRYAEPGVESIAQAFWFSLMTLVAAEPIGAAPTTTLGRLVTVVLTLGGLTVFAVLTGTVSAVMIDTFRDLKLRPMALEDLEDHVVVCGWNEAGSLIVEELLNDRRFEHIVLVTERSDMDDQAIVQAHPSTIFTVQGDYTRLDVLEQASLEDASHAILLADDSVDERSAQDRDARTVLAAMLTEKLNEEIHTTVQLLNQDNQSSLREIGVEEIIVSDQYVGNIMATVTKNEGIVTMLDELLTSKWGHQFFKEEVPDRLVGKTVGEAMVVLKRDYDATLLAVDRQDASAGNSILVNPPNDFELEAHHRLFVAAGEPLSTQ